MIVGKTSSQLRSEYDSIHYRKAVARTVLPSDFRILAKRAKACVASMRLRARMELPDLYSREEAA